MDWNETTIAELRALWASSMSTAEIGVKMHISKNAVVGKAHRLNLPSRPSPIRRDGVMSPRRRRLAPRVRGATLAPLDALAGTATLAPLPSTREAPPVRIGVLEPLPGGRVLPCAWPIGEPGTKAFHFCDVDAIAGRPYCADLAALAYTRAARKTPEQIAAAAWRAERAAELQRAERMSGRLADDNGWRLR